MRYFDTAPRVRNGLSEYRLGHALRERDRNQLVLSTKVGRVVTPTLDAPSINGQYRDIPPFVARLTTTATTASCGPLSKVCCGCSPTASTSCSSTTATAIRTARLRRYFHQAIVSAFPALESLRDQGMVKAIGFGINETDLMMEAVKTTDVDVCLLAGRYTLLEQEPLDALFPMCQERGVGIVLAGVYNSGVLAKGPVQGARFNYAPAPDDVLTQAGRIEDICRRHNVALAAAALQFAYAHPVVVSVCIGSRNQKQQAGSAELFESSVPEELWAELRARS